jgi:hypothetical protein
LKEVKRIMATNEVKAAERGEARGGMRIAKPQLAALIIPHPKLVAFPLGHIGANIAV